MDDSVPGIILQGNWFMMVDPAWDASTQSAIPTEMMVGGWPRHDDGTTGPFRPNPGYRPSAETVPTDPIDALLRQITADTGAQLGDELLAMVRDSIVAIGCAELGRPLIGTGPDGKRCVVAATAEVQKTGIGVDQWRSVHGAKLSSVVPPGIEVLLNPAGSAPFRLARLPT